MQGTIDNTTIHIFRRVFGTPEGVQVLNYLLSDLGLYDTLDPQDVAAAALRNYATRLLQLMGTSAACNTLEMTKALTAIRPFRVAEKLPDASDAPEAER